MASYIEYVTYNNRLTYRLPSSLTLALTRTPNNLENASVMTVDIKRKVEQVRSGTYSRQQLENLRSNAGRLGVEEVVSACDEMLAKLPKSRGRPAGADIDHEVVERRSGYSIMRSAYDDNSKLLKPHLVPVAEELARDPHVSDVAVLKSEIRLYFKGRHLVAGCRPKKQKYYLSCLNETKITDSTVDCWKSIGDVSRAKYFTGYYVLVEVKEITQLLAALQYIVFT